MVPRDEQRSGASDYELNDSGLAKNLVRDVLRELRQYQRLDTPPFGDALRVGLIYIFVRSTE